MLDAQGHPRYPPPSKHFAGLRFDGPAGSIPGIPTDGHSSLVLAAPHPPASLMASGFGLDGLEDLEAKDEHLGRPGRPGMERPGEGNGKPGLEADSIQTEKGIPFSEGGKSLVMEASESAASEKTE